MNVRERTTITAAAYAAASPEAPLAPFTIERRAPGPHDVLIEILYCGVSHSDIHQVRDELGDSAFPMVPGHEIVGRVARAGADVRRYAVGDFVGVGRVVDSCRECSPCSRGEEQYCERRTSFTYNSFEQDGTTPTFGGYSTRITVDEAYVVRIPENLPLDAAAPLLCAGITAYSPLRRFNVQAGDKVGVIGLGGLGHLAVKFANAMDANVTVLSHSPSKREDALLLGADDFIVTTESDAFEKNAGRFDLVIDTVSAAHDYGACLGLLRLGGTMVVLGHPAPTPFDATSLIAHRCRLTGSMIGGIWETQEMLDFCGEHGIVADIEVIPIDRIAEAYERTVESDVRYRFVVDIASLKS